MTITDLVAPEAILPALKVNSKKQALQELAARAATLSGQHRGAGRQFLQRLLLAVDLQRREDRLGCDQIGDRKSVV